MEGRQLVLNDGTIILDGEAGHANGILWCYMTGYTLQEAAAMFFDVGKTSRIVFIYGEMQDKYEGYTTCFNISIDVDGRVSVGLKRSGD